MSLNSRNSNSCMNSNLRVGAAALAIATSMATYAGDAKVGAEATVTSDGVVPSLTFKKSTSDTTQIGGAIGISSAEKDVVGVIGVAPTKESAMAIYGGVGQTKKDGEHYNTSGVGMKYNHALTGLFFDAVGFGMDAKKVSGGILGSTSTQSRSGYTTTTNTITTEQPETNIYTFTIGGVKYTENGAWTLNAGPSSLNGKSGAYAGVNYFSKSGNSVGLSTQHGTVMASVGTDVSDIIAKTINATFGTTYATNTLKEGDALSLLDVTVHGAINSARLAGLAALMPGVTTKVNSVKAFDGTQPFIVDSTNITKNADGSYSINIVPSLRDAGKTTLPSNQSFDISNIILPAGVSIQSISVAATNPTVTAGFVSGTTQFTINVAQGTPAVNPNITITGTDGNIYKMTVKTMKGQ